LAALWADDYDGAIVWAQRAFDLVDEIPDPDLRAEVYWSPIVPCVGRGRFREARRLAAGHDEINAKLTPHHRVHGVAVLLEVEELVGAWDRVRALEERTTEVVEANLDTPCVRNARALLLCAIARLNDGDDEAAMRLEKRADEIALHGYGLTLDAPRARLALLRGDLERVEGLLRPTAPSARGAGGGTFHLESQSTLLDGLAAIGDRERVEAEARPHLKPKTYLEPFAQRALGVVYQDDELIGQAVARFEELQLHWHGQQTSSLLELQA
jgi:hypothetical protein